MKAFLVSSLLCVMPLALMAQTAPKAQRKASRVEIKSQASQMAIGIMAAEAALTLAELVIAERVYVGRLPCELGAFVTLAADPKSPGYFNLQLEKLKYRMVPVATTTGAIRLEDRQAGAVWLQLANKSMLMNHKLGKRLVDACMNPAQVLVADAMEKNPTPSVLDAPVAIPEPLSAGPAVVIQ